MEALTLGQLVEQFENGALLVGIADRQGQAAVADHDKAWLRRCVDIAGKQTQAVMPVKGHVERQARQPSRWTLRLVKVNLLHRCRKVVGVTLLFERGAPADSQRKVQHLLERDDD